MNVKQEYAMLIEELQPGRKSLRIAVVTETYPPEVNGVALTVERFVHGLRDLGHEIQLIRPRQSGTPDPGLTAPQDRLKQVLMRGMPIPRYPHLKMGLPAKRQLVQLWSYRRPDVIHLVTEGPLGWSALKAAMHLKLPITSDFRTNFHLYSGHYGVGWLKKPIGAYLRKFHNRTQLTMVPTEQLRADLAARGFRNLEVVARGVDTQLFSPGRRDSALRRSWGADESTLVVLYVGRLAPEKNLQVLPKTFAAIRSRRPDARLVFVGDGPARKILAQQFPDAVFAGMRSGPDLAAHYASGDLFLFPSLTETFGNVTLEAMASGLAIIAFNQAAAGQLIKSCVNGMLAEPGNGEHFVQLASELSTESQLVSQLRVNARETALAYAWSQVVRQLEEHLIDLVADCATSQMESLTPIAQ
jgi:glycosyltransferase involved in cell wall biosynthesis